MEIKRKISYKKHILSFLITSMIFIIAFSIPPILETKRFDYLEKSKENLQKEVILLNKAKGDFCAKIKDSIETSRLQKQINKTENNLMILEASIGENKNLKTIELKKNLSLIQWEYLKLIEKSNLKCQFNFIPIIHIYSTKYGKNNYEKQKFVFTYLNEKYLNLKFFSFDYDLEIEEIKSLKSENFIKKDKVEQNFFPIIRIKDKIYYGFKDADEMEKILEEFTLEVKE